MAITRTAPGRSVAATSFADIPAPRTKTVSPRQSGNVSRSPAGVRADALMRFPMSWAAVRVHASPALVPAQAVLAEQEARAEPRHAPDFEHRRLVTAVRSSEFRGSQAAEQRVQRVRSSRAQSGK